MKAEIFSKITLKGAETVNYSWETDTVGVTSIPIVASATTAIGATGGDFHSRLIDSGAGECVDNMCPSLIKSADTLQNALTTKQDIMDKYNHDTSNSDAAKEILEYSKFTTVDSSGLTGIGTMIFEGAHDATAAPAGEAAYVQSIERLEGSTVVILSLIHI